MVLEEQVGLSAALAALWLRGGPRPCAVPPGRWPAVLGRLRACRGDAVEALRSGGFWYEASVLDTPGLLAWAADRVRRGECLTAACPGYPSRWLDALGARAPAAVWQRGSLGEGRWVAVVGGRTAPRSVLRFAREAAVEAVRLGFGVVSGRAEGCDTAGATGAFLAGGEVAEVLPYGLAHATGRRRRAWLSVCAPDEPFSRAAAMERNALIYAMGDLAVVCQARYREGGTWHGAVDALRRRTTRMAVREDGSPACEALVALGATPISEVTEIGAVLAAPRLERGLFSLG